MPAKGRKQCHDDSFRSSRCQVDGVATLENPVA
jgi:hypothetical protein